MVGCEVRAGRCQPLTGGEAVPHHKGGSAERRDEGEFFKVCKLSHCFISEKDWSVQQLQGATSG